MPIRVRCPKCKTDWEFDPRVAGQQARCVCGDAIVVPDYERINGVELWRGEVVHRKELGGLIIIHPSKEEKTAREGQVAIYLTNRGIVFFAAPKVDVADALVGSFFLGNLPMFLSNLPLAVRMIASGDFRFTALSQRVRETPLCQIDAIEYAVHTKDMWGKAKTEVAPDLYKVIASSDWFAKHTPFVSLKLTDGTLYQLEFRGSRKRQVEKCQDWHNVLTQARHGLSK